VLHTPYLDALRLPQLSRRRFKSARGSTAIKSPVSSAAENFSLHNEVALPLGVGWMFYFLSTTFYGKLTFLKVNVDNALLLSFLKAIEFFILSCFHLSCMFISARIGGRSNKNDTEE
jgi:hypothetical protein